MGLHKKRKLTPKAKRTRYMRKLTLCILLHNMNLKKLLKARLVSHWECFENANSTYENISISCFFTALKMLVKNFKFTHY